MSVCVTFATAKLILLRTSQKFVSDICRNTNALFLAFVFMSSMPVPPMPPIVPPAPFFSFARMNKEEIYFPAGIIAKRIQEIAGALL